MHVQKQLDLLKINKMLDNCLTVSLLDKDDLSLEKNILNKDKLYTIKNYGNKPSNFKFETTHRDTSLTPDSVLKDIINYENAKVTAEQNKDSPTRSISYSDNKNIEALEKPVLDFFNRIQEIKTGIIKIDNSNLFSGFVFGALEDLEDGMKNGKFKPKTLRNLHTEVNSKLEHIKEKQSNSSKLKI
jgi:hypothetical protein